MVTVGTPPDEYEKTEYTTVEVHFHDFANLPSERNNQTASPQFTCLGRKWELRLFPGGDETSDPGNIAVYLAHMSHGTIKLDYKFTVENSDGKQVAYWATEVEFGPGVDVDEDESYGHRNFGKASGITNDVLVEGALL